MDLQRTVMKWDGGIIDFDCVEVEDMSHDTTITRYPIEAGAKMTDHIILEPASVRLTVYVSNAPLFDGRSHMDGVTPEREIHFQDKVPAIPFAQQIGLTSVAGIQIEKTATFRAHVRMWGGEAKVRRVTNVYNELLAARAEGRIFTVVTEMQNFDSMAIKQVRMNRTNKSVLAPRFDLELMQIASASLATRTITRKPKKERSKPPEDKGKQQAPVADAKTEQGASLVFQWLAP